MDKAIHRSASLLVHKPDVYTIPDACAPLGNPPNIPVINAPQRFFGIPKTGVIINESRFPALLAIAVLEKNCVITAKGNIDGMIALKHISSEFFVSTDSLSGISKAVKDTDIKIRTHRIS